MTIDDVWFTVGSRCSYEGRNYKVSRLQYVGADNHLTMVCIEDRERKEKRVLFNDSAFMGINEPIKAQQEFKVGDKVTVVKINYTDESEYLDTDAVVNIVCSKGCYVTAYDGSEMYFTFDEIKLTKDVYKGEGIVLADDDEKIPAPQDGYYLRDGEIQYHSATEEPPSVPTCTHPNKYINQALYTKFYVCPDCLTDLGDA